MNACSSVPNVTEPTTVPGIPSNRGGAISILIADDFLELRRRIRELLDRTPGFTVIGEASSGREAVELAQALRPQVILMDFKMPEMDGMEATRRIVNILPETKVLILSMYNDPRYVAAVLSIGASGYLLKDAMFKELIPAIQSVIRHPHPFISQSFAQQ